MKSIKEKAEEYAKNYFFANIHFEAGANYVLDAIATVLNQPMNDYLVLEEVRNTVKQLKK